MKRVTIYLVKKMLKKRLNIVKNKYVAEINKYYSEGFL